ncbi:30S ribosomal protein S6 [Mycoplasma sp. Pen4]|uniref:30S ribosomal protein S6 n=1 Tax=Mycoplasma sp. Pen4 TaxID=640330 RepID=UPI0016548162|nr:30S ribosomal protein S6 [Mycoplasma sp. Pen4]QNM93767.1 30S ribosomal protein S6 [Mycoplasma sp. Pen4]
MNKYEIMSIVSPKADVKVYTDLVAEVFGKGVLKVEKLERNELAYEINKSKHAQYVLAYVESDGTNIAEFTRRTNIIKDIWRILVINLDTENGLHKAAKEAAKPRAKRVVKQDSDKKVARTHANKTASEQALVTE